jgi:hypothetical protein
MAVKTFEREVKQLSSEFSDLIENYDFEEYDFHSIRQTLQDYIEQTYPNYNDFFRSDYVMMLIELFAFYGEMMAYRVDMNMNEAYLSTAKDRGNIIKIADMLGYKYARIEPSVSINKINISDEEGASRLIIKKKQQGSINDILSKSSEIVFEPMPTDGETYYPYKIDYLFKTINASEFMNTLNNVFGDLTDFSKTDNIKVKRVIEDNFEYYERSIFVDKFQMRFEPNSNVYIDYAASRKMFEIQGLEYDDILYFNTEETVDALKYNDNALYNDVVELGFEFVIRYDKGNNVLDKNVYMYMPIIQGGTFTREIDIPKGIKNFKEIAYEKNIFNNPTVVRQFDANNNLIRTYQEVENLSNHNYKYAYEVNNTPEGFIELVFGDGKNSEILLPASKTLLYYRKNALNTEEIFNVKNADLISVSLTCPYYDSNVGKDQSMVLPMYMLDKFNAVNGLPAETDDQIKYMARKLRSVQDRFVTGSDYETAGMLHPRVKYTTVILRTYIGKNSSRMSNEFIDVYFDSFKNEISTYDLADVYTEEITDRFVIVPTACFTESSVTGRYDHLKFVETGDEYYFEIFDADSLPPNEWFKYPEDIISDKSKGTVVKITNKLVDEAIKDVLVDKIRINNILPLEYSIETLEFIGSTSDTLNFNITVNKDLVFEDIETAFTDDKPTILDGYNALITEFTFSDISIVENRDGYTTSVKYSTNDIIMPTNDLSFIWTHYKSDDIFINPSKSNIIEIYVSGMTKNLKKDVEVYEPLTSSEINKLVTEINKRKMISDIVQVYNASTYEIETAIRVHKSKTSKITNELLKSKIDKQLDNFFDISNIPLGTHFYMSRLIEWLHTQIPEIQHIEMLFDEHEQSITPSSTIEVLGERIIFTQIVEKTQEINDVVLPQRTIEIIS